MNEKLFGALIGVVLTIAALSVTGYTLAYTQNGNSETDTSRGSNFIGMHAMMDDD
jgi:hypothetical protein